MTSIPYYDEMAEHFYQRTIHADVSLSRNKFLDRLPAQSHILDAGCGSGRDAKYFANIGHNVTAFDASKEMVKIASKETQKKVLHLHFQALDFSEEFDGIWACASLLHVPYEELFSVLQKMHRALKPRGIFYASFKYGSRARKIENRYFFDMDEKKIETYFSHFEILETWKTEVVSSPDIARNWLHLLCCAT